MEAIRKLLVTDANGTPVAVQIDIAAWERIESALRAYDATDERVQKEAAPDDLLEKTHGIWPGVDGLEYQMKIREEWDRPWDDERRG